jgi:hypothetical protein
MEGRERPTIPPGVGLRTLLNERARHLNLSRERLAELTPLSAGVIRDALAPTNASKTITHHTIVHLASALELDVAELTLYWAMFRYPELESKLRPIVEYGNHYLPAGLRSLALRYLLSVTGVTSRKLASLVVRARASEIRQKHEATLETKLAVIRSARVILRSLEAYLRAPKKYKATDEEVTTWLAALPATAVSVIRKQLRQLAAERPSPASISLSQLDEIPDLLRIAHVLKHTWISHTLSQSGAVEGGSVDLPYGTEIFVERSRTIFGAVDIERFTARRRSDAVRAPDGHPMLVANPHPCWEIGVVLQGRVRLDLHRKDGSVCFSEEVDRGGIVFFSSRFRHVVEFLHDDAQVLTINIRKNVIVGRQILDQDVGEHDAAGAT